MTHIGIICPAAAGHLNPMNTLGYELKKRGHRVTIIGIEDARPKAIAAGLEFAVIGQSDFPSGAMQELFTKLGNLSGTEAFRFTLQWITDTAQVILQDAPEVVETEAIEALLVDQATPEGGSVAEHLNIPFISICSAMMLNRDINVPPYNTFWEYDPSEAGLERNRLGIERVNAAGASLRQVISDYRQQWNLPPHNHPNQSYSQLAQISQQPAELEFPRLELPAYFHFAGSFSNPRSRPTVPFPYEQLTAQPLIYASLGTIQNRLLWVFEAIAQACLDLDVQLVIALGGGAKPETLPKLPGNPIVVGYAPQLELLPKAALTITHAGMNTTLESLSYGVPMVAIPITNDQPGVAARIAWTGTGEAIPLAEVSAEKLHQAIKQVLTEDSYRQNAFKLQKSIEQAGGTSKAADIIERAIATNEPVLADSL